MSVMKASKHYSIIHIYYYISMNFLTSSYYYSVTLANKTTIFIFSWNSIHLEGKNKIISIKNNCSPPSDICNLVNLIKLSSGDVIDI